MKWGRPILGGSIITKITGGRRTENVLKQAARVFDMTHVLHRFELFAASTGFAGLTGFSFF
jgi:hypothetical protein